MIQKGDDFKWSEVQTFADQPGMWVGLSRQGLFPISHTNFEVRYFEVAPGGFTTYEQHYHEHCMVVLRGSGKVRMGDDWTDVNAPNAIYIPPMTPHQLSNPNGEPLGYLCIVDRNRDNPVMLDSEGRPRTSE